MMISVVMSVYNSAVYLDDAIRSILRQTYQDWEMVIVNDASSDSSGEIIDGYRRQDPRIRTIVNERNIGLTASLNKAIRLAKGEYVARMDADDVSAPGRLQEQLAYLDEHDEVDILGTYAVDINDSGEELQKRTVPLRHEEIAAMLRLVSPVIHPTVMFRKNALAGIGFYDERYRTSQDIDLWFRCLHAGLRFRNLPRYLLQYRVSTNFELRRSFRFRYNDFIIRKRGYRLIGVPWHNWPLLLLPLILGIVPSFLYRILKKIDPR